MKAIFHSTNFFNNLARAVRQETLMEGIYVGKQGIKLIYR